MSENTTPQGSGPLTVNNAASAFLDMMEPTEGADNSQPESGEEIVEETEEEVDTELVDSVSTSSSVSSTISSPLSGN